MIQDLVERIVKMFGAFRNAVKQFAVRTPRIAVSGDPGKQPNNPGIYLLMGTVAGALYLYNNRPTLGDGVRWPELW